MSSNISLLTLIWISLAFIAGSLIGFIFRSKQLAKSRKRVLELETEMVENHAEILRLHKLHAERPAAGTKVPVINLPVGESSGGQARVKG